MANRTPMMDQYYAVKQSCEDALLFFRLGDFYELFFEDALVASQVLDLTLTGRGKGDNRSPMCGVPYHAADNYIARLVSAGFKVAVCDQVEDPKVAKGIVKREITRIITPGTGFDYLREDDARTLIATVSEHSGTWAGTVADPLTGDQWVRSGSSTLLRQWFSQLAVRELVVDVAEKKEIAAWTEKTAHELKCVFSKLPHHGQGPMSTSGSDTLIRYLEYTGKRKLNHMKEPVWVSDHDYMQLTASAMAHLELLRPLREGRKGATLFESLDQTKTAMGKRHLKTMIERPLREVERIAARQDSVGQWVEDVIFASDVQEVLQGMYDLERIVSRISFGSALPRDLVQLARSLKSVMDLRGVFAGKKVIGEVASAAPDLRDFDHLITAIRGCLVDDPQGTGREGGIIRSGYNSTVDQLRELVQGGRTFIAALEQSERARTGIRSLKIGYNRVFGYYIEISTANLHLVPSDYERKQTLTNGERFVTPELRKREQEILAADDRLKELEWSHFESLLETVQKELRDIQNCAEAVGLIDALLSLAQVASRNRYVRPIVDESSDLVIRQGRHPVVENHVPGEFVPNDLRLNDTDRRIALITGPNMAGKSTYMRQVAHIVILSQMGSFVPADYVHAGIVDKLFTRIGASDDVSAGLSTFMVEMTEAAEILRDATAHSMILLDEIGRGTATYDGLSIAEAMVEYIHEKIKARTLFATHYHELTALPNRLSGVFNLSVAVVEHGDEIVFLHQIVERAADRSYGIQVAKIAGLPTDVTKRAKHILKELESSQKAVHGENDQLSFPFEEHTDETCELIRTELVGLSLDDFTPRNALSYLYDLQLRVKEE